MKIHAAASEQARALVDPILRDWEMEVELTRNRGELRFIYEDAEIIDRTPPTPGIQARVMKVLGGNYLVMTGNARMDRGYYKAAGLEVVCSSPAL